MTIDSVPFTHNPYAISHPALSTHRASCPSQTASQSSHSQRRSARPESEGANMAPVCLDYLKGICQLKRLDCKYAHPHIPLRPGESLCEVFVLTGECKFGERCRDYHPPLEMLTIPVCAPAQVGRTDEKPVVPPHVIEAFEGTYDMLVNLLLPQYDYVRESCYQTVTVAGASSPLVAGHLASIFVTAALTDASRAVFTAHLCEYIHAVAFTSEIARAAFKSELLDRFFAAGREGQDIAQTAVSEEEKQGLTDRRFAQACFFGCLAKADLIPSETWDLVVESLAARTKKWDVESSVAVRLLCRLLQTAGTFLKEARPEELQKALRIIRSSAPRQGKSTQAEVTATYRGLTAAC